MKLENQVIAITGASRGIGRGLAIGLAKEGAGVALCARNLKELKEVEREIKGNGGEVFIGRCDIAKVADVKRWVSGAVKHFGQIDVLINNAGLLGAREELADYPEALWKKVMDVNVNGSFYVTKSVLRQSMLKKGSGIVINVSSGVGRVGKPKWGPYVASKFAMEGMTQMLAAELKSQGIRVFAINPEPTRSIMRKEAYPQEDPNTLKTPETLVPIFKRLILEMSMDDSGKSFSYSELV